MIGLPVENVHHRMLPVFGAAPIVLVSKPFESVRICRHHDLKVNQNTKFNSFPLPCNEDIDASVAGGKQSSSRNLKHVYNQPKLDETGTTTANTRRGLFRYKLLQFGVSSARVIFQCIIDAPIFVHTLTIFL